MTDDTHRRPSAASAFLDPPPWLEHVLEAGQSDRLRGRWSGTPRENARASAVLMLFGPHAGGGEDIVLTQRAENLRKHAGQVSFPGGGVEPHDATLTDTALREAREEIGLDRRGVHVLGELAPLPLTVTNFVVNPVLAWWNNPTLVTALDPVEVARVARVSVAALLDPSHRFTATHPRGYAGPAFEVDGLYIWGFTAYVLDAVFTAAGLTREWDADDRRQVPEKFLRR